jgi:hypothetical protein
MAVLFVPFTQKALAWLRKNCSTEEWQWENDKLSVGRSTAEAIIQGMKSAGCVVANDP